MVMLFEKIAVNTTSIYCFKISIRVLCLNLTFSWQRLLSYRNQSIDLLSKSMDWFLYDNGLRHERVNVGANQKREGTTYL